MFYLNPSPDAAHVNIFYRNFLSKGCGNFCHIGLGVNGTHTCRVLRKNGIRADLYATWTPKDIHDQLIKTQTPTGNSVTHAIIEAPWVHAKHMQELLMEHPTVHFVCRNHSQIGFLQVEAGAIKMIRDYFGLQESFLNFTYSANNSRYCDYAEKTYRGRCVYLPNLYDLDRSARKHPVSHDHRALRIASFGSLRLLKNHTTSAAAAQLIARSRNCDLEFWISTGREEHGKGLHLALQNMFRGMPGMKLVENPWQSWDQFRHTVSHMDLLMQPSFTETFNIVSADACAEGVPVVGSDAIEWLPAHWQANVDDPADIARIGNYLLSDIHAASEGLKSLTKYLDSAIITWKDYLNGQP